MSDISLRDQIHTTIGECFVEDCGSTSELTEALLGIPAVNAAPELIEALEGLLEVANRNEAGPIVNKARVAIRKARGET